LVAIAVRVSQGEAMAHAIAGEMNLASPPDMLLGAGLKTCPYNVKNKHKWLTKCHFKSPIFAVNILRTRSGWANASRA
jgi:hypothetical protein